MTSAARPFQLTALALASTAAVLALGTSARPAAAAATCGGTVEHPFRPWVDPAAYTLTPGGTFESSTPSWKLAGGAKLVAGNEPFEVHGSADRKALSIPAGGSATSPAQCVDLVSPTLRFFAVGGSPTSLLKVDVIYRTVLGTFTQPVTLIPAKRSWGPTTQALILANATGLLSLDGLTSSVQFRFTALGSSGWQVDDVYVDPWKTT